jgi:hypothetical protein
MVLDTRAATGPFGFGPVETIAKPQCSAVHHPAQVAHLHRLLASLPSQLHASPLSDLSVIGFANIPQWLA